jgi:hypothetical protein
MYTFQNRREESWIQRVRRRYVWDTVRAARPYRLLDTDHKGNLTIAKTVVFFENKFPDRLVDDSKPTPDPLPVVSEFYAKDPDDIEEAKMSQALRTAEAPSL